jgi:O-antigen/teichoic acid export membrane protein
MQYTGFIFEPTKSYSTLKSANHLSMNITKLLMQQIIARTFLVISSLLVNICLARFTNAAEIGVLLYITAIGAFIVLVGGMSLESAFTYFSVQKAISKKQIITLSFWQLTCVVFLLILMQIFFPQYFENISHNYRVSFYVFIAGTLMTNYFTAALFASQHFILPNLLQTVGNIACIIFISILYFHNKPAQVLFKTYFYFAGINGLLLFMALVFIKNEQIFNNQQVKNKQLIYRYALQALGANLLFFLVYRLDYWFVQKFTSANDAGNYMQASKLAQIFILIPQFMAPVIFNASAMKQDNKLPVFINTIIQLLFLFFLLVALLLLLFGNAIIIVVFGNSFSKVANVMLILMPGLFFLAVLNLLSAYFSGLNKISINIKGAAMAALITLVGNMLIIPYYHIHWAAAITSFAYAIAGMWSLYHFKKMNVDVFFFKKLDWRKFALIFRTKN